MRAHAVRVRAPDAPDRDCVYPSTHPTRSFLRPLLWLSAPGSARCDRNQGAVLRPHWKGRSGSRRTLGPNAGDVRLAYVATARKPEARAGAGARQASSHGKASQAILARQRRLFSAAAGAHAARSGPAGARLLRCERALVWTAAAPAGALRRPAASRRSRRQRTTQRAPSYLSTIPYRDM